MEISNNAVYNEPQLNKIIQIRNASLLDIYSPIIVINISKYFDVIIKVNKNIFLSSTKSFIHVYR